MDSKFFEWKSYSLYNCYKVISPDENVKKNLKEIKGSLTPNLDLAKLQALCYE